MIFDPINDDDVRTLWLQVILQAFSDATATPSLNLPQIEIEQARSYLIDMSDDFIEVCSMANLVPNWVKNRALKYKNRGWTSCRAEFSQFYYNMSSINK